MSKSVEIVTDASSGIGRATAIRLARDFSTVVLAARGAVALAEVAEQVRAQGAEPLAIDLDLMALPLTFGGKRPKIRSRAPKLGEHNATVRGLPRARLRQG